MDSNKEKTKKPKCRIVVQIDHKFGDLPSEQYAMQLGMLNRLLRENLITDAEYQSILRFIKKEYNIKNY